MRKATMALIAAVLLIGAAAAFVLITTPPREPSPPIEQELHLELAAEGLVNPIAAAVAPGIDDRVFIVDQVGTVRALTADGLEDEPFLDLRDEIIGLNPSYDERGLLSIAFHPDYPADPRVYAFYTAPLRDGAPDGYEHTTSSSRLDRLVGRPVGRRVHCPDNPGHRPPGQQPQRRPGPVRPGRISLCYDRGRRRAER